MSVPDLSRYPSAPSAHGGLVSRQRGGWSLVNIGCGARDASSFCKPFANQQEKTGPLRASECPGFVPVRLPYLVSLCDLVWLGTDESAPPRGTENPRVGSSILPLAIPLQLVCTPRDRAGVCEPVGGAAMGWIVPVLSQFFMNAASFAAPLRRSASETIA